MNAPVTFGQLSVIRSLSDDPAGAAEANVGRIWRCRRTRPTVQVVEDLHEMCMRHESLRTRFILGGTRPHQIVSKTAPIVTIAEVGSAQLDSAQLLRTRLQSVPFDLEVDTPVRFTLLQHDGRPTFVVAAFHHVAADQHALALLEFDFRALQSGRRLGPTFQPSQIAISEQAATGRANRAETYWREHWPTNGIAVPPGARSRTQVLCKSGPALAAAHSIATRSETSVQAVVVAALCSVLADYLGTERLAVSLMASNRVSPDLQVAVTSLNQWVPITFTRTHGPRDAEARQVYAALLIACMRARYDVDRVQQGRVGGDRLGTAPGVAVNFLGNSVTFGDPTEIASARCESLVVQTAVRSSGPVIDVSIAHDAALELLVSGDDSVVGSRALGAIARQTLALLKTGSNPLELDDHDGGLTRQGGRA